MFLNPSSIYRTFHRRPDILSLFEHNAAQQGIKCEKQRLKACHLAEALHLNHNYCAETTVFFDWSSYVRIRVLVISSLTFSNDLCCVSFHIKDMSFFSRYVISFNAVDKFGKKRPR